jgi:hypothetical protein
MAKRVTVEKKQPSHQGGTVAKLQLFRGLPDFDWREAMVDALTNGAFQATGTGLSQIVMLSGANVLTIPGTGGPCK